MNAALPAWNASRPSSSKLFEWTRNCQPFARGNVARITLAAPVTVGCLLEGDLFHRGRDDVAACRREQRVSNRTVQPFVSGPLPAPRFATLAGGQCLRPRRSSPTHVVGGVRNEALAVPEQLGAGVQRRARTADPCLGRSTRTAGMTPSETFAATSFGHGTTHFASANSAIQLAVSRIQVDVAVLGGEAAHELLALLAGVARKRRRPRSCSGPSTTRCSSSPLAPWNRRTRAGHTT